MPRERTAESMIEIAATAARLIAEDGLDYASAKRKAVEILGTDGTRASLPLPDNALVEFELRRWLTTFEGERYHGRLRALRELAVQLMQRLAAFNPHLVGAVLNGAVTDHSDIWLHLFTDSAKDVEIFLLDEGVQFEVFENNDVPSPVQEAIQFVVQPARARGMPARVGVVLTVHMCDAIRIAPKGRSPDTALHPIEASGRASREQLVQLLAETKDAS